VEVTSPDGLMLAVAIIEAAPISVLDDSPTGVIIEPVDSWVDPV
jgi:hypothetical protein